MQHKEEEEAVFIRDSITNEDPPNRRSSRRSLHVKIEGDPLDTQHAQQEDSLSTQGARCRSQAFVEACLKTSVVHSGVAALSLRLITTVSTLDKEGRSPHPVVSGAIND